MSNCQLAQSSGAVPTSSRNSLIDLQRLSLPRFQVNQLKPCVVRDCLVSVREVEKVAHVKHSDLGAQMLLRNNNPQARE